MIRLYFIIYCDLYILDGYQGIFHLMQKAFDPSKYVGKNLTADNVVKLKEVFDVFDYDGSGNVSADELINTIKALNLAEQAAQVLSIVQSSGHQGEIDFGTFLSIFGFNENSNSEGTLQSVYEAFDPTGKGMFDATDFERVASSVGEHFTIAEVDQIMEYADRDRDGGITYDEFVTTVTKVYPKI